MSRETEPVLSGMSGKIADYRLDGYIGRGSMAVVYLAQNERLDRAVALKVLAPELARDAAFRTRFLHESRAAAAIGHPHIIPVYEAGDAGGTLYLAMRYVQGGDARSLLNRLGPLPFGWAWSIIAQVASALDAAHTHGLIHRDVRPANMLLDADHAADSRTPRRADGGDFDHVYLSDFGISKPSSAENSAMNQFAGTLDYVAPEQVEGRAVDGRADLYSLACAGFELLCGTPPFGQDQGLTVMYAQLYAPPPTASARRPDLPAAVDRVLATALAKNPAERYPTCAQFADELGAALGVVPGEAGVPAPLPAPDYARPGTPDYARPGTPDYAAPDYARPDRAGPDHAGPGPPDYTGPATLAWPTPGAPEPTPEAGPYGAYEPTQAQVPVEPGPMWQGPGPQGPEPRGPGPQEPMLRESVPQGPVLPGPDWPWLPDGQPPAGPDQASPGPANGLGRIYPVPPPRPRSRRTMLILVAAAAAIVIAAVFLGLGLSGGSAPGTSSPHTGSSAPPTSSASTLAVQQAVAVNHLLGSSAVTRRTLVDALTVVRNCGRVFRAAGQIRSVVDQRSTEYNHALALSTAAMARGATVKSDLLAALRHSLIADRDYLIWARQQLNSGCTPASQSPAYRAAVIADRQADASKGAFVQVWNQVAARYGVPQKSPNGI